jgi:hypothetical protein
VGVFQERIHSRPWVRVRVHQSGAVMASRPGALPPGLFPIDGETEKLLIIELRSLENGM